MILELGVMSRILVLKQVLVLSSLVRRLRTACDSWVKEREEFLLRQLVVGIWSMVINCIYVLALGVIRTYPLMERKKGTSLNASSASNIGDEKAAYKTTIFLYKFQSNLFLSSIHLYISHGYLLLFVLAVSLCLPSCMLI
jgi:hypothetical protein